MDIDYLKLTVYLLPMLLIFSLYFRYQSNTQKKNINALQQAKTEGLTEPASLHPVINPAICIGCGSCVTACPEGKILGLIKGKAQLISPSHCIGHGACKSACPMDAISLVFGTEKRGMDIPLVSENFETNVPGIFIAGELGGMGLIRNAITQGSQAIDSISKQKGIGKNNGMDVIIVGSGPAGFAASLGAMQKKLKFVTLEQESLGGTVFHFPRGKIVMTAPVNLPIIGKIKMRETTKEALLEFWQNIEKKTGLDINYNERVESIAKTENGFEVKTSLNSYQTKTVLLSIGRRGTPRKLGVPGEELPKVVYRLIDPEQYKGQHVLVVGGGDSALEAATSIAAEDNTNVTLSYRGEGFARAKEKNRKKVEAAQARGNLDVLLESTIKNITPTNVIINHKEQEINKPNDGIIVCAGGILPTKFLQDTGIIVETKHGTS